MSSAQKPSISRIGIVLLCLLAWFVFSNHCALARLAAKTDACPHCSQSAHGDSSPTAPEDCCKHLKLTADFAHPFHPAPLVSVSFDFFASIPVAVPPLDILAFSRSDAGPPRALSLVEILLTRSLQAHAPPSLV